VLTGWNLQPAADFVDSSWDDPDDEWTLNREDETASDEDDSEDRFSDGDLNEFVKDAEAKYGAGVY
jgi:hypothetical protein